jgi:hypothetical protein
MSRVVETNAENTTNVRVLISERGQRGAASHFDQTLNTTDSPTFADIAATGDVTVTGTLTAPTYVGNPEFSGSPIVAGDLDCAGLLKADVIEESSIDAGGHN